MPPDARDKSHARNATCRALLDEVWSADSVNRADLSRRTGLSRTTVSDVINEFIGLGVFEEVGAGPSRGGRPPIVLSRVKDSRVTVGIEAGASHVEVVVMNLLGEVLASRTADYRVPHNVEGTLDLIRRFVFSALDDAGVSASQALGAGIAVSSPLDGSQLRKVSPMTMPAWDGIDVVDLLEACLGLPVTMDNDANLGALAERWWGDGRGCDHFTYVKLGVGVGAGHFLAGDRYMGWRGGAGEIGHINAGGNKRCRCQRVGCMEMEVGSDAIVATYLDHTTAPMTTSIGDVIVAATDGDESARQVIHTAGRALGTVLAPLMNLLNPQKIILGGPLTAAGPLFLDPVRTSAVQATLPKSAGETEIIVSQFEQQTVALGAATAALDATFDGGVNAWRVRNAREQAGVGS